MTRTRSAAALLAAGVSGLLLFGATGIARSESPPAACDGFYATAHATNNPAVVDAAIGLGANAIEFDLQFAEDGEPHAFTHGWPCTCTFSNRGLCAENACSAHSDPETLLHHLVRVRDRLALVVFDLKVGDLAPGVQAQAGTRLAVRMLERLHGMGFDRDIVLSVPKLAQVPVLQAAFESLRQRTPERLGQVYFSVDQEGNDAGDVIAALRTFTDRIAYGTGSAFAGIGFVDGIAAAKNLRVPFAYVWTVDEPAWVEAYLAAGARGVMTDDPARIREAIETTGGNRMARPGDRLACGGG